MMKFYFFIYLSLLTFQSNAQDLDRVRKNIDTLCSEKFFGRGYLKNGDKIAAEFLSKKYEQIGLEKFNVRFLQTYPIGINTFPKEPILKIDGKKLVVGRDFLPSSDCPNFMMKSHLLFLDSNFKELPHVENRIVVFHQKFLKEYFSNFGAQLKNAAAIILITEKLTHSVTNQQITLPIFYVLNQAISPKSQKIEIKIEPTFLPKYETQNVIGYLKGTKQPEKYIVFTAHYDHLGGIGNTYFAGANDNASGIAMLLELAYHYQQNPPDYSVVFIAFGAEEVGLLGSYYYTENPLFLLSKIRFLINLDLFGTGENGIMVVNGKIFSQEFEYLTQLNQEKHYLSKIESRGKAANSDHYWFSEKGVPAFFFYLMGNWKFYHDIEDVAPLPLTKFTSSFELLKAFANGLMKE